MKVFIIFLLINSSFAYLSLSNQEVNSILEKSSTYPFCQSILVKKETRTIHTFCQTKNVYEEFRFHNFQLYYYKKQSIRYSIPYEKPIIRY